MIQGIWVKSHNLETNSSLDKYHSLTIKATKKHRQWLVFWKLGCSPVKYCQTLSPTRRTVWHGIFAGSNFAIFPAIRKKKVPANKKYRKIYSRENILQLKFTTQKYSTEKSCLFTQSLSETKAVYNEILTHTVILFENMYFYCTYSIKTKILLMLGTGYFMKIAKIKSRQEKPICPNRKNQFPKTQKIANPQK